MTFIVSDYLVFMFKWIYNPRQKLISYGY